jgi:hypothetical protein
MFGKLSVALLIAVTPAVAQDAPPSNTEGAEAEAPKPVAYKTKKICRSIEVVGSSIPKRSCSTKRVPIEPPVEEEAASDASPPQPDSDI